MNGSMAPPSSGLPLRTAVVAAQGTGGPNVGAHGAGNPESVHTHSSTTLSPMSRAQATMADLNRWLAACPARKECRMQFLTNMVEQFFSSSSHVSVTVPPPPSVACPLSRAPPPYIVRQPLIRHFFSTMFSNPQVCGFQFHLGNVLEKVQDSSVTLHSESATLHISIDSPRAETRSDCVFKIVMVQMPTSCKIQSWDIRIVHADECIPIDLIKTGLIPRRTQCGVTTECMSFLKISQVLPHMCQLMRLEKEANLRPRECLEVWAKSMSVDALPKAPSMAAKPQGAAVQSESSPASAITTPTTISDKKVSPAPTTTTTSTEKPTPVKRKRTKQPGAAAKKAAAAAQAKAAASAAAASALAAATSATAASPDTTSLTQSQSGSNAGIASTVTVATGAGPAMAASVGPAMAASVGPAMAASVASPFMGTVSALNRASQLDWNRVGSPTIMATESFRKKDERIIRRVENPHHDPVLAKQQEDHFLRQQQNAAALSAVLDQELANAAL